MVKIVISGYYGFANAGDEAMLTAILCSLRDLIPEASFTVISGNPALTEKNHQVQAVHRFNIWAIFKALSHADLLISGGGSLLQDVTSSRSLYYYLLIMRLALFLHVPVMLYAQGIGPVRRPRARQQVRNVLQRVSMISVRDEESRHELGRLGVTKPPVYVTADAVLSLPPVSGELGSQLLSEQAVAPAESYIGIAVRNWQGMTHYKEELAKAADELIERLHTSIVFIPMQYPADAEAADDIAALMKNKSFVLRRSYTTQEFMALTGCMRVVIANRLHALIFASVMGVPTAAISYDPKIDGFVSLIGDTLCGTIESVQAENLVREVCKKYEDGGLQPEVRTRLDYLRRQSLHNASLALRVIEEKPAVRGH